MNISLRRGEKIYINGAVVRPDRKVCIELLNDVTFLLENHVMQASDASTPLKQLYFVVQLMLISPNDTTEAMALFEQMSAVLNASISGFSHSRRACCRRKKHCRKAHVRRDQGDTHPVSDRRRDSEKQSTARATQGRLRSFQHVRQCNEFRLRDPLQLPTPPKARRRARRRRTTIHS